MKLLNYLAKYEKSILKAGMTKTFLYYVLEHSNTIAKARKMLLEEIKEELDSCWYTKTEKKRLASIIKRLEKEE